MNLLNAKLYDPSSAVSKATSSLLAMTAFDTTNLRLAVTVPAHGMVRFNLQCMLEGATTFPQILLGVLNGSTVVGRVAPQGAPDGTALATTFCTQRAEFTVTGLTPGATNFDAAYGVETVVASTNIKYGGPNNTTANDAFGGFVFEAWDPQPQTTTGQLSVDANGRVDVIKIAGTTQTARDLGASVLLSSGTGTGQLDITSGVTKANATQFAGQTITCSGGVTVPAATLASTTNITSATGITVSTNSDKTGYGLSATAVQAIWDALTSALTTAGSIGKLLVDNLNATISSRLASASYTAPDNAGITAIKAKTDSLGFTVAGQVDANIQSVNDVTVTGDGSAGTPWGP